MKFYKGLIIIKIDFSKKKIKLFKILLKKEF